MDSGHWKIMAWLCAVFLTGCGGSSGESSSSTPPPVGGGDEPVIITTPNAPMIAGSIFDSLLGQGSGRTASGNDGSGAVFAELQQTAQTVANGIPIQPVTSDCPGGGTITMSGEVADPQTLSQGDSFTLVFDMCNQGDGATINGSFTMTVFSLQGDLTTEQFVLVMDMVISDFQVMEGGEMASGNGDIRLRLDTTAPPVTVVTSSGSSVTLSGGGVTQTMTNFSVRVAKDEGVFPVAGTLETSGAITSTAFEGEVTFSTPVPFQAMGDEYPFTGELLITGADGATIRLIALDSVNVRLEIDTPEAFVTIDTTWAELEAQA